MIRDSANDVVFEQLVDAWVRAIEFDAVASLARSLAELRSRGRIVRCRVVIENVPP